MSPLWPDVRPCRGGAPLDVSPTWAASLARPGLRPWARRPHGAAHRCTGVLRLPARPGTTASGRSPRATGCPRSAAATGARSSCWRRKSRPPRAPPAWSTACPPRLTPAHRPGRGGRAGRGRDADAPRAALRLRARHAVTASRAGHARPAARAAYRRSADCPPGPTLRRRPRSPRASAARGRRSTSSL